MSGQFGGLSPEEVAAYHDARAASVASDAAYASFAADWEPRLRERGLSLEGQPLAAPGGEDDIRFGPDEPEPDWDRLGVVAPAVFPPGSVAIDFLEFVAQGDNDDEEEWFVRGLIPAHSFTVLGGHPKTGKTLFAFDLGFAAASGREFFGRETAQATFLYVTEEGSPVEMRKRARRLIAAGGLTEGAARLIYRRGTRFDDPRSWQLVRDEIDRIAGPTLLVLDPLRDLLIGDENDSTTLAHVGRAIHAILADFADVTVILLHHLSKRGEGDTGLRLRGSSALWGTADCTLLLKPDAMPDDLEGGGEVPLRGVLTMQSRIAASARYFWRWDAMTGFFLEASAEARTVADKAAAFLTEHGPSTLSQLAEALGTTTDSVGVSLRRERNRFRVTPGEGPNDPSVWGLVE